MMDETCGAVDYFTRERCTGHVSIWRDLPVIGKRVGFCDKHVPPMTHQAYWFDKPKNLVEFAESASSESLGVLCVLP